MVTFAVKCKCLQFFRSLPMVHHAVHPLSTKFTCCKIAEQINSYKGMIANSALSPGSGRGDYSRDERTKMTAPGFTFIHSSPLERFRPDPQCTLCSNIGGLEHIGVILSLWECGYAHESRLSVIAQLKEV